MPKICHRQRLIIRVQTLLGLCCGPSRPRIHLEVIKHIGIISCQHRLHIGIITGIITTGNVVLSSMTGSVLGEQTKADQTSMISNRTSPSTHTPVETP